MRVVLVVLVMVVVVVVVVLVVELVLLEMVVVGEVVEFTLILSGNERRGGFVWVLLRCQG